MELRSSKAVLIWLAVFAIVFVLALWFVRARELRCAEGCSLKGFAQYQYKGFSGSVWKRSVLSLDSCTCTNVGGVPVDSLR
jgi:hypothetical protein